VGAGDPPVPEGEVRAFLHGAWPGRGETEGVTGFDVVVLAGGGGQRLGGVDKGALLVGGRSLLDHVLVATEGARATVVVGPERATARPVTWACEDPAGGGPLAALAAGLAALPPGGVVVVLATDLPDLDAAALARLLAGLGEADGVVFVDAGGRRQPLAAAYRAAALRAAVRALEPVAGKPVRLLFERLDVVTVPDLGAAADCDTPDQLAQARARHGGQD
jgi:molybdopterin-guanine dinucleotide biosynthesis protein A